MPTEFSVDRAALAAIGGLGCLAWPAVMVLALGKLGVLDPASLSGIGIGAVAVVGLLGLVVPLQIVRQLRGARRVTISEHGISVGGAEIAWSEVTGVQRPTAGTVVIRAGARGMTLQTYLFRGRDQLEKLIRERAPPLG